MKETKNVLEGSALYKELLDSLSKRFTELSVAVEKTNRLYICLRDELILSTSKELVLDNNVVFFFESNEMDLEFLEFVLENYLLHLVLDFPDSKEVAFIQITGIPESAHEFLRWFISIRFILTEVELAEHFGGEHYISNELVDDLLSSPHMKDHKMSRLQFTKAVPTALLELEISE